MLKINIFLRTIQDFVEIKLAHFHTFDLTNATINPRPLKISH